MKNCCDVPLFIDLDAAEKGRRVMRSINVNDCFHMLYIGASGAGKTTAVKLTAARLALAFPKTRLFVCDFKGSGDFSFLRGKTDFYEYAACLDGLRKFYEILQARQSGTENADDHCILVFDEMAAFISSLQKKEAEEAKTIVGNTLMLGRSMKMALWCAMQRGDASYWNAGTRDNFHVLVMLGNLSSESRMMFVPSDLREQMRPVYDKGAGYMQVAAANLYRIRVGNVTKFDYMHDVISSCVR